MKRVCVLILALLILLPGLAFCESKITFESVMNAAQMKSVDTDEIPFDDFCNNFKSLCTAWDASWNTDDVSILSKTDSLVTFDMDGVQITCEIEGETHPIREVAVMAGTDSTSYSMGVKTIALMATLEYDAPKTVSERKTILDAVTGKITDSMYFMSLLASSKEEGSEITAIVSTNFSYAWRYSGGNFYFVAK